ncbi:FAD/NAD(P)-binding domain-containing protein [Lentithecium fluviatile CBS 122367]|uniref:FAD/NAD(P)-binding domain-containing protein n=1 Tax=Lentithecium fluviatile CBS 122367 TaxID=1168545 RepID=A0A6G1IE37_9PLEO|nr:FAD/NAD(P)-binding domain-containing protein [Lentithecium fluviatile CBS 122367]
MGEKPAIDIALEQVVIIGGGFGGLAMACELKRKLGFHDFVIYERDAGLGGTWYHNNYPGAATDIPGAVYQLSFAPEHNFDCVFPTRNEIQAYIESVASKFEIHSHLRCNYSWIESSWIEKRNCWRSKFCHTISGELRVHESRILISATGHLVNPKSFDVPGRAGFKGSVLHSARWPEDVDLKGKNIVVLGNGSTAVQLVPAILDDVRTCTQIQKEPQWILNRPNPQVPASLKKAFLWFPFLFSMIQHLGFAFAELFYPLLGRHIPRMSKKQLKQCAVPKRYHKLLTPSYEAGCKRLVFASHYLQCLKNLKFDLVQDSIIGMGDNDVHTASGRRYPCDVLILAHGFEYENFTLPLKGRHGITPEEHWQVAGGPSCYKGCVMNGFPNFFMLRGPNMASGHNSVIYYIETTIALILAVATPLIRGSGARVEIKSDAELNYARKVQAACREGVWGRGCSTYYVNGEGWNHTVYPWSSYRLWFHRFWRRTEWTIEP